MAQMPLPLVPPHSPKPIPDLCTCGECSKCKKCCRYRPCVTTYSEYKRCVDQPNLVNYIEGQATNRKCHYAAHGQVAIVMYRKSPGSMCLPTCVLEHIDKKYPLSAAEQKHSECRNDKSFYHL